MYVPYAIYAATFVLALVGFLWMAKRPGGSGASGARSPASVAHLIFGAVCSLGYAVVITSSLTSGEALKVIVGLINVPFVLLFPIWFWDSFQLHQELESKGWRVNAVQSMILRSAAYRSTLRTLCRLIPSIEESRGQEWHEAGSDDFEMLRRFLRQRTPA